MIRSLSVVNEHDEDGREHEHDDEKHEEHDASGGTNT
jgi:hypothetical protein